MYVWIKYRTNTSASLGQWEYAFIFDDGHLTDERVEQMFYEQWMDNDGYRGMDWGLIDKKVVPKNESTQLLDSMLMEMDRLERYIAALVDQT